MHIEEPEPPAPVTEPEKTFEEVLDEHPVSIQMCIRDSLKVLRGRSRTFRFSQISLGLW